MNWYKKKKLEYDLHFPVCDRLHLSGSVDYTNGGFTLVAPRRCDVILTTQSVTTRLGRKDLALSDLFGEARGAAL